MQIFIPSSFLNVIVKEKKKEDKREMSPETGWLQTKSYHYMQFLKCNATASIMTHVKLEIDTMSPDNES